MKKAGLIITSFLITIVFCNLIIEQSLNITSRNFVNNLVKPRENIVLKIAIFTYDMPRPYRAEDSYSDLNGLVMSLLYLENDKNLKSSVWGIRQALDLLSKGINKYPKTSEEHFYLLLKRVSILNRVPARTKSEELELHSDILSLFNDSKNLAYLHIEDMLFKANIGDEAAVNSAFDKAIETIEKGSNNNIKLNKIKFEFYKGYADCINGNEAGGSMMLDSYLYLRTHSASFNQAMVANWDGVLIGYLKSQNSRGYDVCHDAASKIEFTQ